VTVHDLARRIGAIAQELIDEADVLPGTNLAYGRPHDSARDRYSPRYSRSGDRIPGARDRIPHDCPRPVKGRCECKPDGSWRPVGGAQRADLLAVQAAFVRSAQVAGEDGRYPGLWTDVLYHQQPNGLWICLRPMRRAFQRLHGESARRYLVMDRIFAGQSLRESWKGLGTPVNLVTATLSICEQLEAMAHEEALAEYERRPRRWRDAPWSEKSEAQQLAETGS
jgi:hypothetical protein